jgi:hypothetical protein
MPAAAARMAGCAITVGKILRHETLSVYAVIVDEAYRQQQKYCTEQHEKTASPSANRR